MKLSRKWKKLVWNLNKIEQSKTLKINIAGVFSHGNKNVFIDPKRFCLQIYVFFSVRPWEMEIYEIFFAVPWQTQKFFKTIWFI